LTGREVHRTRNAYGVDGEGKGKNIVTLKIRIQKPCERPRRRLSIKTHPIKMWVCGLNSNYIRIRHNSGLF